VLSTHGGHNRYFKVSGNLSNLSYVTVLSNLCLVFCMTFVCEI